MTIETPQNYYAKSGPLTNPGPYRDRLCALSATLPELVPALQKLTVHIFWASRYGLELSDERQAEVQLRPVQSKLKRLLELDPSPLTTPRPLEKRLVCNCRDISTLLVGVLRAHGIPARARCGFGTYFLPDHYEDHWVIERWDGARWVMADGQLDALMHDVLGFEFDPLDMPPGQFVLAGQAWQMCRRGDEDPDKFGIFEWHGMDFIRGNVLRDFLTLNKIETLPWDFWGTLMAVPVAESSPNELALIDRMAELTLAMDASFAEVRALYAQTPEMQVPPEWLE